MKTLNLLDSACRFCRYYQPEGRRGGMCQQLGAPVQGSWKACALALPKFAPAWEGLDANFSALDISQLEAEGGWGDGGMGRWGDRGNFTPSPSLLC